MILRSPHQNIPIHDVAFCFARRAWFLSISELVALSVEDSMPSLLCMRRTHTLAARPLYASLDETLDHFPLSAGFEWSK